MRTLPIGHPTIARAGLLPFAAALALGACSGPAAEPPTSASEDPGATETAAFEPIEPLPLHVDLDPRKVALGEQLFADVRLSRDGTVACTSCHLWSKGGADGLSRSHLPGRPAGSVNVPTIWNVAYDFRLNWNGKFDSLEQMIDAPLLGAAAMATTWADVVVVIEADARYRSAFRAIYPEGVTAAAVRDAIAVYERSLTTPNAPFDRFLRGDGGALSGEEIEGYATFKEQGCASCHQGRNIGGNLFQKLGIMGDYFAARGGEGEGEGDLGRFAVTHREEDRHVFRVPSLRNVALTAPYLHDGSAATLEEVIAIMARYQLGRAMTARQTSLVASFLRTLTGERAEQGK